jgi:hypothetical protein
VDNSNYTYILKLAHQYGWECLGMQDHTKILFFKREEVILNVYFTSMTVATCLNHLNHGRTQLFRRNVSMDTLKRIFKNPRAHTGAGYLKKHKRIWYGDDEV